MRTTTTASMFLIMTAATLAQELPVFTDVTDQAGITFRHSYGDFDLSNIVEGTGAGVVVFDYDGDGWMDLYFLNGAWNREVSDNRGRRLRGRLHNALYRNKGDGTFEDVTTRAGVGDAGYGTGGSAADYDNDGDVDLYVLNYGPNVFYENNGDGTFSNRSKPTGLDDPRWSLSAPWFDADGDGDLDVYVANYLQYDSGKFRSFYAAAGYPGPLSYSGQPDALYRNNGDGTFTDIAKAAGVFYPDGRAMSAAVADLNNDGHLDIYVTNDAMGNTYFRSLGDGRFVEEGLMLGLAFGEGGQGVSSMGPAVGDVDRDGLLDIYIPDMGYGCVLMNRRDYFEDRTAPTNLAVVCGQYTGWGGLLFDYDNDGFLDVYVANGNAHHEYTEEDVLMRNDGHGKFIDVAKQSGAYFSAKYVGRGATFLDYDNDGDLDLLVVNLNDRARLLRNDGGNRRHWLTLAVKQANGRSDAIGARLTVWAGTLRQVHDLIPVTGYLSQADSRAHFGLGSAATARIEIRWPDGQRSVYDNVPADHIVTIVQGKPIVSQEPGR